MYNIFVYIHIHIYLYIITGSWKAIFRVWHDFYSMKSGVKLYMHERWCKTLHHITIHS